MGISKFIQLNAIHLKLSHLFALIKSTIELALPLKGKLNDLTDASLTILEENNTQLDKRLKQPAGSFLTPELKKLDKKRDSFFEEIKRNVKISSKSSDPVKNNAGKTLLHFLTPYWDTEKQALNTETALIQELNGRYNNDQTLLNSASIIGITVLWNEMNETNNSFDTLYDERNAELAAKEESAGKLKAEVVKNYTNFCTLVEQSVNITPSEELTTLFDRMDNLRKTYRALIPKKKNEEKEVEQ